MKYILIIIILILATITTKAQFGIGWTEQEFLDFADKGMCTVQSSNTGGQLIYKMSCAEGDMNLMVEFKMVDSQVIGQTSYIEPLSKNTENKYIEHFNSSFKRDADNQWSVQIDDEYSILIFRKKANDDVQYQNQYFFVSYLIGK